MFYGFLLGGLAAVPTVFALVSLIALIGSLTSVSGIALWVGPIVNAVGLSLVGGLAVVNYMHVNPRTRLRKRLRWVRLARRRIWRRFTR